MTVFEKIVDIYLWVLEETVSFGLVIKTRARTVIFMLFIADVNLNFVH